MCENIYHHPFFIFLPYINNRFEDLHDLYIIIRSVILVSYEQTLTASKD